MELLRIKQWKMMDGEYMQVSLATPEHLANYLNKLAREGRLFPIKRHTCKYSQVKTGDDTMPHWDDVC
jgi:hypothetical protein